MVGAAQGKGQEPLRSPVRVLLTGAGGQLGTDIGAAAASRPEIELIALDRTQLDVTRSADVQRVGEIAPDVVLHTAAFTEVDRCESEPALAMAVNGDGTRRLAEASRRAGARLIYISTDYVFDGSKPEPYHEADRPHPASVYGRTKLAGEQALSPDDLIVRTSWVCGVHGSNMVKTILRLAASHDKLTFVDDQVGKPTFTRDLAEALLLLATRDDTGVMHITNEGVVSWFEFCRAVLDAAGLDPARVVPCSTEELQPPRPAPRPANSVLANTRFPALGLPLLRDFREPLAEVVAELTRHQVPPPRADGIAEDLDP